MLPHLEEKRRAQVITRTHESFRVLPRHDTRQASMHSPDHTVPEYRVLPHPESEGDTRVITCRTLSTRALEDLPSKYSSTLLLARALDKAPRVTAKTAHLIVYSKWVHH